MTFEEFEEYKEKNLKEYKESFLYLDDRLETYKTKSDLIKYFDLTIDEKNQKFVLTQKYNYINMRCQDIIRIIQNEYCYNSWYDIDINVKFTIDIEKVSLRKNDESELYFKFFDMGIDKLSSLEQGYFYMCGNKIGRCVRIYPKNIILHKEPDKKQENIGYDKINPGYYKDCPIEIIDCIKSILTNEPDAFKGYLKGNIIKYISRENKKNGKEDLEKAKWYLNKLINEYKGEHND